MKKQWRRGKDNVYRNAERSIAKRGWPAGYIRYVEGTRWVDVEYEVSMRGISIWPERLTVWAKGQQNDAPVTADDRRRISFEIAQWCAENGMQLDAGIFD